MGKFARLSCVVGRETERMLRLGHPWVLADNFTAKWPKAEPGTLVELRTETGSVLGTALLDPKSKIVARLIAKDLINLDKTWLEMRLRQAEELRRWINLSETNSWRLVNAEGDGLPGLCVDKYGDYLLVQYFTAAWEPHLALVISVLKDYYQPQGIYTKFRPQQTRKKENLKQAKGQLRTGSPAPHGYTVNEHSLFYQVDMINDLNTGLFLDQRFNRLQFRKLAAGHTVLNLFAYTGSFSVAAAAGGAIKVTSVDVAERYLKWAKENFRHNGINLNAHEFIPGDCFSVLDFMQKKARKFDLILMDPPSFSTTHTSRFTTSRGTAELVRKALSLLPKNGMLLTSSNLQKMPLNEYLKELRRGTLESRRTLRVINVAGQGGDFPFTPMFPEGQYLKFVTSVVQD